MRDRPTTKRASVKTKNDKDSEQRELCSEWLAFASAAFGKDWENDLDAIYDDWKLLYGITEKANSPRSGA